MTHPPIPVIVRRPAPNVHQSLLTTYIRVPQCLPYTLNPFGNACYSVSDVHTFEKQPTSPNLHSKMTPPAVNLPNNFRFRGSQILCASPNRRDRSRSKHTRLFNLSVRSAAGDPWRMYFKWCFKRPRVPLSFISRSCAATRSSANRPSAPGILQEFEVLVYPKKSKIRVACVALDAISASSRPRGMLY